jgi:DNA processing protein
MTGRRLSDAERLDWLRLIRTENVGPVTFMDLLGRFGSAGAAREALPELSRRGGRQAPLRVYAKDAAQAEIDATSELGAKLIARGEPDYPSALAAIENAPPLITARGRIELLGSKAIAVVGARNASANGVRFARQIATDLGAAGYVIASGFARGIDTAAHGGALETGTIAVMAGGVDIIFPPENEKFYATMIERGVAISDRAPGYAPRAKDFPRRNRIISGLSVGVVVVEAAMKSGSLTTARMALEQGREVFAVPGSPLDPRCRGTNDLLRQGATLTESADDVLRELGAITTRPLAEPAPIAPAAQPPNDGSDLAKARVLVNEKLGPNPVAVDEIIRQCHLSPPMVLQVLLELELAGRLARQPGNQVYLLADQ